MLPVKASAVDWDEFPLPSTNYLLITTNLMSELWDAMNQRRQALDLGNRDFYLTNISYHLTTNIAGGVTNFTFNVTTNTLTNDWSMLIAVGRSRTEQQGVMAALIDELFSFNSGTISSYLKGEGREYWGNFRNGTNTFKNGRMKWTAPDLIDWIGTNLIYDAQPNITNTISPVAGLMTASNVWLDTFILDTLGFTGWVKTYYGTMELENYYQSIYLPIWMDHAQTDTWVYANSTCYVHSSTATTNTPTNVTVRIAGTFPNGNPGTEDVTISYTNDVAITSLFYTVSSITTLTGNPYTNDIIRLYYDKVRYSIQVFTAGGTAGSSGPFPTRNMLTVMYKMLDAMRWVVNRNIDAGGDYISWTSGTESNNYFSNLRSSNSWANAKTDSQINPDTNVLDNAAPAYYTYGDRAGATYYARFTNLYCYLASSGMPTGMEYSVGTYIYTTNPIIAGVSSTFNSNGFRVANGVWNLWSTSVLHSSSVYTSGVIFTNDYSVPVWTTEPGDAAPTAEGVIVEEVSGQDSGRFILFLDEYTNFIASPL